MAETSPESVHELNGGTLVALIRNLDLDRAGTVIQMREWLAHDRDGFYRGALDMLRGGEDPRGMRPVVELLMGAGMLEDALCDQGLALRQAVKVGRIAMEVDPRTDVELARRLAESLAAGDMRCALTRAPRLISVLAEISDGIRILPSLARLLHNANPYLRSKLVLMIARANRSTNWVQSRMADADPRIRANVVEALWELSGCHARELLAAAAHDNNNRVAGNALLGLYRLGDCSMLAEAVSMARHQAQEFRATAAWLMGETGDDRFRTALAALIQDPVPMVRSRALKALARIRAATEKAACAGACRVTGFLWKCEPELRRVRVGVTTEDGKSQVRVLPAQFRLSEDGVPLMKYKVADTRALEPLSVVFVLPCGEPDTDKPWITAAVNCLQWKRSADTWGYLPWSPPAEGDEDLAGVRSAVLQTNSNAIETVFRAAQSRRGCPDFWHAFYSAVKTARTSGAGKGCVVALCHEPVSGIPGPELMGVLLASPVVVQVISAAPNPELETLCKQIGTNFRPVAADGIGAAIEDAYLALLGRYEISYQPAASQAGYLEIRVRTAEYCGQAALKL